MVIPKNFESDSTIILLSDVSPSLEERNLTSSAIASMGGHNPKYVSKTGINLDDLSEPLEYVESTNDKEDGYDSDSLQEVCSNSPCEVCSNTFLEVSGGSPSSPDMSISSILDPPVDIKPLCSVIFTLSTPHDMSFGHPIKVNLLEIIQ